jgi:hypothetical protein
MEENKMLSWIWWGNLKDADHLKFLGVERRIILIWILKN